MTSDRPSPPFDFDDDERQFLADAGLPAGQEAPWRACPSLPLLLAADEGVLPPETQEQVAAHVIACAFCRSLLQDVKEAGLETPTAEAHERIQANVRSRSPQPVAAERSPAQWRRWMSGSAGLPLAASLTLAVGLGWYARSEQRRAEALEQQLAPLQGAAAQNQQRAASLEEQVAALRLQLAQPEGQPNVPVVDLEPVGARRASDGARIFSVPASARFVTLILQLDVPGRADGLTAEIRDGQNQPRWSIDGLRASAAGVVTVLVPRTSIPDGDAVIALVRTRDGNRVTVGEYRARLTRE